jgi:hypothetical protein
VSISASFLKKPEMLRQLKHETIAWIFGQKSLST